MNRSDLENLYRKYGSTVARRARALVGPEQAEDVVQEVFLRVFTSGSEFRNQASPSTWLYRITTNHCLNLIRNRVKRWNLSQQNPEDAPVTQPAAEPRLAFQRLLERVPDELREIAIYYYVDEMSHEEIAELLGVSRRTVGNRLTQFRALANQDQILNLVRANI